MGARIGGVEVRRKGDGGVGRREGRAGRSSRRGGRVAVGARSRADGGRCGRAGRTVQVLDVRGGHDPLLIAVRDERLAGDVHLGGDVHGGADGGGPVVVVARARLAARVRVLREEVHPGAWTRYSPLCSEPSESLAQGDRARAREMRCGGRVFSRSARGLGAARTPLVAFHLGSRALRNNFRLCQRDSARGGFPIRLSTRDRKRRRATRATITSRNASHGRGRCARGEVR